MPWPRPVFRCASLRPSPSPASWIGTPSPSIRGLLAAARTASTRPQHGSDPSYRIKPRIRPSPTSIPIWLAAPSTPFGCSSHIGMVRWLDLFLDTSTLHLHHHNLRPCSTLYSSRQSPPASDVARLLLLRSSKHPRLRFCHSLSCISSSLSIWYRCYFSLDELVSSLSCPRLLRRLDWTN